MFPDDLFRGFVKCCVLPYGLVARERRPGVTILAYHRVGGRTRRQLDLSVEVFAWQMRYLRQHHTVISLDSLVDLVRDGRTDRDAVVITFDDGSADLYEHAFPILRDLALPATLYLATSQVETGQPLPFESLLPSEDRSHPLSWNQIEKMLSSGLLAVGAHTHTHLDLSALTAPQIEDELNRANTVISRRLGSAPKHFAYPWARGMARARSFVNGMYVTAAIAGTRKNAYAAIDLHALRRVPLQRSDGRVFFRLKLESYLLGEEVFRTLMDGRRRTTTAPVEPGLS